MKKETDQAGFKGTRTGSKKLHMCIPRHGPFVLTDENVPSTSTSEETGALEFESK